MVGFKRGIIKWRGNGVLPQGPALLVKIWRGKVTRFGFPEEKGVRKTSDLRKRGLLEMEIGNINNLLGWGKRYQFAGRNTVQLEEYKLEV
jgi:hypothetical protein